MLQLINLRDATFAGHQQYNPGERIGIDQPVLGNYCLIQNSGTAGVPLFTFPGATTSVRAGGAPDNQLWPGNAIKGAVVVLRLDIFWFKGTP